MKEPFDRNEWLKEHEWEEREKEQEEQDEEEDAEQEREDAANRKKLLIKLGAVNVFLAIVLIISTISWFTFNRSVQTTGMSIRTRATPFEIATKGAIVRHESLIEELASEYQEGTSATLEDENGHTGTYYLSDSLQLRFDPVYQDNPLTPETDERYLPHIGPGSGGALSLYVVPHSNEASDIRVTLNVVAFAEIDKFEMVQENGEQVPHKIGTELVEIGTAQDFATQANTLHNTEAASEAADYVRAVGFLRSHLLFFGGTGNTTAADESSRYYYTTFYPDRTIEKSITAGNEGKAVAVPVYWMWTNTFGQVALPDNISGERSGYPILADNDSQKQIDSTTHTSVISEYVTENRAEIFANNGANTESHITAVTTPVNSSADFDYPAFTDLSRGYNQADYAIGTRIAYFMIEVTVESDN